MKMIILIFLCFLNVAANAKELLPYTVFLKEGAPLTSIKFHTVKVLSKSVYAKAKETNIDKRDEFIVYDKENKPAYYVEAKYVVDVDEDYAILPKVDATKIYPPRTFFGEENKFAPLETQVNLHLESFMLSSLNEIYRDKIAAVLANRFELRTMYHTHLPYSLGASVNYQTAFWRNDYEEIKLSILSLGPHFKYSFQNFSDNFKLSALLGGEFAPLYEGVSALSREDYTATLYDVGVEAEWSTQWGTLSLGSHFRHHEITLLKSDRPLLKTNPKEFTLNTFGGMIGYKIDWSL
jgi:hypothetical protein